ncbi:MAG: glycoside hydrolase family 65 protein [Acidimicrobiales bacterium]
MELDPRPLDDWPTLTYHTYDPGAEKLREALCAVGNGVWVTRGAQPWGDADDIHYPATYLAGGYDRATSDVNGRPVENEDLVNFPNWLPITFRFGRGPFFGVDDVELLDYRQDLLLGQGRLERRLRCRDGDGRVFRLTEERLIHMEHRHLGFQRVTIELEERSGDHGGDGDDGNDDGRDSDRGDGGEPLEIRIAIDGAVRNRGVDRYAALQDRHVEVLETGGEHDRIWLRARTISSHLEVGMGTRVRVTGLDDPERHIAPTAAQVELSERGVVRPGRPVEVEKVVAFHTSRDRPGYDPVVDVHRSLECAGPGGELVRSQERVWGDLWRRSVLELDAGDPWADMVLKLHLFHVHQSISDHAIDLDVGVPARGWHGEAYRGHVFWDEIFVLPFLACRFPERARAAIRYRYRRLPEARRAAAEAGHRGAMFPWQSGSTGREENQRWHLNPRSGRWNPDPTHLQRHVGAAIAYNVYRHWCVTADDEFLHDDGAEILLSIADFLASLATWDGRRQRYVIRGVIGPDEYHTAYPDADGPGLDNNAYTNVMTAWVLDKALAVLDELPALRRAELLGRLSIDDDRLAAWNEIGHRLFVPFLPDETCPGRRVIEQFEGYRHLREFDWEGYRQRYGDIARLDRILEAEDDSANAYKASKQADVVMLFYLLTAEELVELFERLDYPFDADDIPANVDYYTARTSHGSTLSRVVQSWVEARADRRASWHCFLEALASDVDDVQGGTTPEGIHLGAMAGTVDLAQRVYSGLAVDGDLIRLNPRLPSEVRRLAFRIRFRTHWLVDVEVSDGELVVGCEASHPDPIRVAVKDEEVAIAPGTVHRFDLVALKNRVGAP